MDDISIVGIILAALAFFLLGGAWYTFLFGKHWRAEMGITDEQMESPRPMAVTFGLSLLIGLIIAAVLAKLIYEDGTGYGFKVGAGAGVIAAVVIGQNSLYESRSLRFFAINASYVLIGLAIMGTIIGCFQAQ